MLTRLNRCPSFMSTQGIGAAPARLRKGIGQVRIPLFTVRFCLQKCLSSISKLIPLFDFVNPNVQFAIQHFFKCLFSKYLHDYTQWMLKIDVVKRWEVYSIESFLLSPFYDYFYYNPDYSDFLFFCVYLMCVCLFLLSQRCKYNNLLNCNYLYILVLLYYINHILVL